MTGYIILFFLFFLCSFLKNKELMLKLLFLIITFFSSIRFGIGYDYYSYLDLATNAYSTDEKIELIPLLMLEVSRSTVPFLFFILSSVFISFFYYKGIKNFGSNYFDTVMFYICFPFLFMDQLGIVRQGMAASVIFYAFSLSNAKVLQRLILVVIAFFCHSSAIIGILLFLPWGKFSQRLLWPMLLSSFFVGLIVVRLILSILTLISINNVNDRAEGYLSSEGGGEGGIIQFLIYIIAVLCLTNYKRIVLYNHKNKYYIGLVILGASLFALFSFNSTVSKRLCMFFFSASVFVVPYIVRAMNISRRIYYILCILLFSLLIYVGRSNQRPEDPAGYSVTYPYRTIFGNF